MAQIVLADDDPLIRMMIAETLMQHGHHVDQADNGVVALRLCDKSLVDLLLTDLVMPALGGLELIQRLMAIHPDIRVLAISGEKSAIDQCRSKGYSVLEKPFEMNTLVQTVDRILQA